MGRTFFLPRSRFIVIGVVAAQGATLGLLDLGLIGRAYAAEAPASAAAASSPIPDAPRVAPAPVLEKPLPPEISQEIPEPRPTSEHMWVPGHWRWQEGRHVWIASHWELPPIKNATWVEPRWEKQANGYVLIEGYWEPSQGGAASAPSAVATTTPPSNVTIITEPPPAPRRERVLERPSIDYVWVSGYWAWRGGRHVWIDGHWERPPQLHAVWVEPRWERRGRGYVLVEGYWREVGDVRGGGREDLPPNGQIVIRRPSTEVIVIREEPPPPRLERRSVQPSSFHYWIPGYWVPQQGHPVWVTGRWEVPPRGRTAWVAPRWERRDGGYVFIAGSWR